MKIGILGSGHIGGTLGIHFARAGRMVFFSSRHPNDLQKLVTEAGNGARMGTLEEATRFGEMVVLAIPWRKKEDLPPSGLFKGKILIEAMNPYSAFGKVIDLGDSTSSEEVARVLPGARLMKAFNTMGFADLQSGAVRPGKDRWAIFVAGRRRGSQTNSFGSDREHRIRPHRHRLASGRWTIAATWFPHLRKTFDRRAGKGLAAIAKEELAPSS